MLTEQSRDRERGACVLSLSKKSLDLSLVFLGEKVAGGGSEKSLNITKSWQHCDHYFCDWICGFSVRGPLASSMNEKDIMPWFHRQGLSLVLH